MLDLTKPINISLVTIIIAFLTSIVVLYLAKPSWIQRLDNEGKVEISPAILISYSITFALVSGIAGLILSSRQKGSNDDFYKPPLKSDRYV